MRHRKKALLAAALCALALLGLLIPASGSTTGVYLMAVNDRVLVEVTTENMPRQVGGVLYVPYTMLSSRDTGINNLGVSALYSNTKRTVLVTDGGRRGVEFDTQANTAQDLSGNPVSARAMVRNSMVFLPIDWLCRYFDNTISYTLTRTRHGTLVRITSSAVILGDREFIDAGDSLLADSLNYYLTTGGGAPSAPPAETESPTPSPSPTPEPSAAPIWAELYLACRGGSEGEECARLLEDRGLRGLFLFAPDELGERDGLIRRLAGTGHTIGLVLDGEDADACLAQLEEGRGLLAAIARCPALVASAPALDEEGREALAQAGCAMWVPTTQSADWPSGSAMIRGLDPEQVNFVEVDCGPGGTAFLRGALNTLEEEGGQAYHPTAPVLARG